MKLPGSYIRAITLLCSTGLFLAGYVFFSSSFIQSFYAAEFHLSSWQIGIAQSCIPLGAIVGAVFAGRLADLFGRHRLLLWNFLLLSIMGLLGGLVFNYYSLCGARLINGFLAGTLYPLCAAYLTEMTPPHALPRQSAFLMFVNCCAAPTTTVLAMGLSYFLNEHALWRILAIFHAFPAMIAYLFAKQLPESRAWLHYGNKPATTNQERLHWWQYMNGIKILFHKSYRKVTICLMGAWFLMDVAFYGMNFFVPYLLHAMQISLIDNGSNEIVRGTLIINIFFMLGAFSAVFIVDKMALLRLQKYGFLASSLFLFLLTVYFYSGLQHGAIIILLFILFNLFINIGPNVTTYLLSATSYPVAIRASGHGFLSGFAKFGSFIGVLFLPRMQDIWGYQMVMLMLALVLFAAYLFTINFPKELIHEQESLPGEMAYETN